MRKLFQLADMAGAWDRVGGWQYIDTDGMAQHDSDAGSGEVCCQFGREQTDHYWSVIATNVPKLITDVLLQILSPVDFMIDEH